MKTEIKERPILFSGEMVRAILAGRKTQTRRIVKPQPQVIAEVVQRSGSDYGWMNCSDQGRADWFRVVGPIWAVRQLGGPLEVKCPYGAVGDRLWVREAWWAVEVEGEGIGNAFVVYDDEIIGNTPMPKVLRPIEYVSRYGRKPSIHMPRWASRLTLEITDVRVQRLQDISEADAEAEGVDAMPSAPASLTHRSAYAKLWNKINGPNAWEANPWVWAMSFKRVRDGEL